MNAADPAPLRRSVRDPDRTRMALGPWLAARLPRLGIAHITDLRQPDGAGVANETLLIDTATAHGPGPALVVRIDAGEHLYLDASLALHHAMYRRVGECGGVPVPAIHAFEEDPAVLGAPFMVMERVAGVGPPDRPNFNFGGWLHGSSEDVQREAWRQAVTTMARLHALDPARFAFLLRPADGRSGLEQSLAYWERYARWCGGDSQPLVAAAAAWLRERLPADAPTGLSWGDARLQNLLFRDGRCVALLDWDMVSLAGPEADLAWWALADHKYTASAGRARLPGIGSPAATIGLWESLTGRTARHMDWHLVFASFRQALISIRLAQLRGGSGVEAAPSVGLQWLSCLLGLPLGAPLTLPFVGLEA